MSRRTPADQQGKELFFQGDLVLQRIAGLKQEMQTALEESDHVLLDISQAQAFDLTFLQLLCSGHRSAVQLNKSLRLAANLPENFQRKLEEAGFVRHVGCRLDCQNSCIWTGQG
jgi:anti-anti-sigma regulatory factor